MATQGLKNKNPLLRVLNYRIKYQLIAKFIAIPTSNAIKEAINFNCCVFKNFLKYKVFVSYASMAYTVPTTIKPAIELHTAIKHTVKKINPIQKGGLFSKFSIKGIPD